MQQFEGIMHRGTHMDAPIHVQENQPTLTGYPLWRFFGTGVVVSIPKGKWGVITPKDLENAEPKIRRNDILMINTGSHLNYGDNPDYLRLFARPLQGGRRMDRRARRQARRHRRAGARSSARHVPRAARAGAGAAASRRRVLRRDRPSHHRRLPALGAGAQDHDDERHSGHREHRRRHRQDHRQALHASSRSRGAGRTAKAARCGSSPCSTRSRVFDSRRDDDRCLSWASRLSSPRRRGPIPRERAMEQCVRDLDRWWLWVPAGSGTTPESAAMNGGSKP